MSSLDPVVELADRELSVEPGGIGVTTARIRNRSDQVEQYRLELLGPLAQYATVQPAEVQADVEREQSVTLHVRPPRSASAPRGAVPLGLRVVSLEDETRCSVDEVMVVVGDILDLSVSLTPVRKRGRWSGLYTFNLHNGGTAPIRVHLDAKDNDRQLAIAVAPSTITVSPGEDTTGYVRVKARQPKFTGQPAALPFVATATPMDSPIPPTNLPASFDRLPIVGRAIAATGALALLGVAAGTVLALRTSAKAAVTAAAPTTTPPAHTKIATPTPTPSSPGGGGSGGPGGSGGAGGSSASSTAPSNAPPVRPYALVYTVGPAEPNRDGLTAGALKELAALGYKGVKSYTDPVIGNVLIYLNVKTYDEAQNVCDVVKTAGPNPFPGCLAVGVQQ
jgi:hypothetical protein